MQRRIRRTQVGVMVGGILALVLGAMTSGIGLGPLGLAPVALIMWLVVSIFAYMRLKCVRCGQRLCTMPPLFCRAWGLHTCAHCGEKQPP
jgi:hypothetical protein